MISFNLDDNTFYIMKNSISSLVVNKYSVEIFVMGNKFVYLDLTLANHKRAWEQIKDVILD